MTHQRKHQSHPEERQQCNMPRCRRLAVFPSGRCSPCEDAHVRHDFSVLDSYRAQRET